MTDGSLRAELEALRREVMRLKPGAEGEPQPAADPAGLAGQAAELNRLVQQMLEEAEHTVANHPVATVAGALALGILIGRLTAH